jgi:hypothetical protein
MYLLFLAVKKFEVSEVMPIIGALQPIFIFGIIWILFGPQPIKLTDMAAFTILILGGFLISFEKFIKAHLDYVKLIAASSLMFSLDFVFLKMIFISMPFWHGLIWSRIFIFLIAMLFLFSKNFRKEVFEKKVITNKKSVLTFFFTQSTGAIAGVLQSFAIALVPVSYLAIMNSLKGLQYVFLFLITVIFSLFFPKILSEKISKKVIIQKTAVILIISFGLAILFIN